jgi:putative chitinase
LITADHLRKIMPHAGEKADIYAPELSYAMDEFAIDTPARAAPFLANAGHESAQLSRLVENLNYSAERLMQVWPKRFSAALAARVARHPESIANIAYANRMGNGDEDSGDGWRYRGMGLFQITGKTNQFEAADALGVPRESIGDYLVTPLGASRSAGWFWTTRKLNVMADAGDFEGIVRRINGGLNGFDDRCELWGRARAVLA